MRKGFLVTYNLYIQSFRQAQDVSHEDNVSETINKTKRKITRVDDDHEYAQASKLKIMVEFKIMVA